MKRNKIITKYLLLLAFTATALTGCKKFLGMNLQDNYDYKHKTLDPNINMTAKEFLLSRIDGTPTSPNDTIFRWMKKGLDYCGLDLSEYEQQGRTYLFLTNDAIRVVSGGNITSGLFYTFPIVNLDVNGNPIIDPNTGLPTTHPAKDWSEYSKTTVKNYFLYLIGKGVYNFYDLNAENKTVNSLLPPGTAAGRESMLGYWDGANNNGFATTGKGFDQAGNFYLRIQNNADIAPIMHNDRTGDRSGGYVTTNGVVHVYGATVYPSK
jgi:hypothetical protein